MIRTALALLAPWRLAPTRRLGEAAVGEWLRVRGRVAPRDLLDSPVGSERCVYYRYAIERWRRSAVAALAGDGFWELVEEDEVITEFWIDDGERRALVSPIGARIDRARVAPKLIDLGADVLRARELVLRPGDRVEVHGRLAEVVDLFDEGKGYRDGPRALALVDARIRPLGAPRAT